MEHGLLQRIGDPTSRARRMLPDRPAFTVVRFTLHFLEMILAMMIGMMVLGGAVAGILAALGLDYGTEQERNRTLFAVVMALNMTVGMAAWMRFRGHSRRTIAEMSGAMVVPVLALLPPYWLGAIGGDALIGLEHTLMLPAMLAVMLYRRDVYSHRHEPGHELSLH